MVAASIGRIGVHLTRRNDRPIVRRLVDLRARLSGTRGAGRGSGLWGVLDEWAARNGLFPTYLSNWCGVRI